MTWEIADPHRYALWLIRLRLSNQPHDGDSTVHALVGIAAALASQLADETGHDPYWLLERIERPT